MTTAHWTQLSPNLGDVGVPKGQGQEGTGCGPRGRLTPVLMQVLGTVPSSPFCDPGSGDTRPWRQRGALLSSVVPLALLKEAGQLLVQLSPWVCRVRPHDDTQVLLSWQEGVQAAHVLPLTAPRIHWASDRPSALWSLA